MIAFVSKLICQCALNPQCKNFGWVHHFRLVALNMIKSKRQFDNMTDSRSHTADKTLVLLTAHTRKYGSELVSCKVA